MDTNVCFRLIFQSGRESCGRETVGEENRCLCSLRWAPGLDHLGMLNSAAKDLPQTPSSHTYNELQYMHMYDIILIIWIHSAYCTCLWTRRKHTDTHCMLVFVCILCWKVEFFICRDWAKQDCNWFWPYSVCVCVIVLKTLQKFFHFKFNTYLSFFLAAFFFFFLLRLYSNCK